MPSQAADTEDDGVRVLGVVGAGLMGSGLAHVAATAGMTVLLHDADPVAADRSRSSIAASLQRQVDKGTLGAAERDAAVDRIGAANSLEDLAGCDAVIEAVVEIVDVKRSIFEALAAATAPDTLLATNTSAIPITEIAGSGPAAERTIGMHFFSPVPAMPLCEIVRGLLTTDATVVRARALATALGKESIVVNRDGAGFVTSRLITVLIQEAVRILEEGLASPEDVDAACVLGFGHRMGPLATADLTGIDVALRAGQAIYDGTGNAAFHPPQLMARMVAAGRLGRKSGHGFYDYPQVRP